MSLKPRIQSSINTDFNLRKLPIKSSLFLVRHTCPLDLAHQGSILAATRFTAQGDVPKTYTFSLEKNQKSLIKIRFARYIANCIQKKTNDKGPDLAVVML